VANFLDGRLGFRQIPALIEAVMSDLTCRPVGGLEEVFAADRAARERAEGWMRTTRRTPAAA
jgi:1-deoxy-D-xylulose-5-phosphate reductoisomerase